MHTNNRVPETAINEKKLSELEEEWPGLSDALDMPGGKSEIEVETASLVDRILTPPNNLIIGALMGTALGIEMTLAFINHIDNGKTLKIIIEATKNMVEKSF